MEELISGKDVLVFLRPYKDRNSENGTRLRFQTEVSLSEETSVEGTATTDGIFNTVADGENSVDFSSLAYKSDAGTIEQWHELKNHRRNKEYMELWIVYNTGEEQHAEYATGYISTFEMSAATDGQVELSYSFAINGNPIEGTETLTDEQLQLVGSGSQEYRSVLASQDSASDDNIFGQD